MRKLAYRLGWDKDFRKNFIKGSFISFFVVGCLVVGAVLFVNNFHYDTSPAGNNIEVNDDGSMFNLKFSEHKQEQEESNHRNNENSENHNSNNAQSNNSDAHSSQEEHHSEGGGSGGGGNVHVHSWFTVVDQPAWDETVQIQVGTRYICRSCGFVTTDEGAANAHTRQTGHGFRTEGIFEPKVIHHSAITHQECSCGARR